MLDMGKLMTTQVVPRNSLWRENLDQVQMCGPVRSEISQFDYEAQKDHQLDPLLRKELLERAKIPGCSVDLFASPQNAQEERFISENENALSFDWVILAQEKPVWIYPPMSILEKTLTKLGLDKAMGVLIFLKISLTSLYRRFCNKWFYGTYPFPLLSM